jgi:polyribonucleotide nucleotidyltransferase
MMVESEAYELSEDDMLGAVTFGHEQMQPVIDMIIAWPRQAAKEPFDFQPADNSALAARVRELAEAGLRATPSPPPTRSSARRRSPPRRTRSWRG